MQKNGSLAPPPRHLSQWLWFSDSTSSYLFHHLFVVLVKKDKLPLCSNMLSRRHLRPRNQCPRISEERPWPWTIMSVIPFLFLFGFSYCSSLCSALRRLLVGHHHPVTTPLPNNSSIHHFRWLHVWPRWVDREATARSYKGIQQNPPKVDNNTKWSDLLCVSCNRLTERTAANA